MTPILSKIILREQAESFLIQNHYEIDDIKERDVQRLIYELQVHQIELEMQNEELRNSQHELQQSCDKYSNLYNFAPVSYLTMDMDGIILDANMMAITQLGVARATLVGHTFHAFIRPEYQDSFYLHRQKLITAGGFQHCDLQLQQADGTVLYVQLHSHIIDNQKYFYSTIHNVTEMKLLESQLIEARDQAQEANIAKSQFLATMSHEIRTPLNVIVGAAHILTTLENMPDPMAEIIEALHHNAQSLVTIIDNVLNIAEIENRTIILKHIPFTFEEVIHKVINAITARADEKQITLNYMPSILGKDHFLGDPSRIYQIVMNLVSNAIKFTPTGGVTIVLRSSINPNNPGYNAIHLAVIDTGIGIAPEMLEHIFGLFTQADSSTTRKFGGTGLGLAISKNLAEMMNGSLTVESILGRGATFILTLPLEYAALPISAHANYHEDKMSLVAKQGCILLVEDYAPNVLVASVLLKKLGYTVVTASNGKEAVDKIRANRDHYIGILMDIQMPEMDGFEATYHIRQEEQEKGLPPIPIIAVTAHALYGYKERCLALGMNDYIAKPVQLLELESVLSCLCKNNIPEAGE